VKNLKFVEDPTITGCMYTGAPLDYREHILMEGLGGRLACETLMCKEFGGASGATLESALMQPYLLIMQQLGVKGKKGDRDFTFQDTEGRRIVVGPDQTPRLKEPAKMKLLEGGKVRVEATDLAQLKSFLKTFLKIDNQQAVKLLSETALGVSEYGPPTVVGNSSFGGTLYTNAIRKTLLSTIGLFDAELARHACLREARRAVFLAVTEKEPPTEAESALFYFDHKSIAKEAGIQNLGDVDHQVLVSANGDTGVIAGTVCLFSHFEHGLVLSTTYSGPSRTFIYCCDPLRSKPPYKDEHACALYGLSEARPSEPTRDIPTRLTEAHRRLWPLMRSRASYQTIMGLLDKSLPEHSFPIGKRVSDISLERFKEEARRTARTIVTALDIANEIPAAVRDLIIDAVSKSLIGIIPDFSAKVLDRELSKRIKEKWTVATLKVVLDNFERFKKWTLDEPDAEEEAEAE
jgi:hypothetical protein